MYSCFKHDKVWPLPYTMRTLDQKSNLENMKISPLNKTISCIFHKIKFHIFYISGGSLFPTNAIILRIYRKMSAGGIV